MKRLDDVARSVAAARRRRFIWVSATGRPSVYRAVMANARSRGQAAAADPARPATTRSHRTAAAVMALAAALTASPAGARETRWPAGVTLPDGEAISEDYRRQFDLCDRQGSFRGHVLGGERGCADDPNRVASLRRLPSGAVAYVSKLSVDLDGSAFACGPDHGRADQCPTALMLRDDRQRLVPVDADAVAYVVIPASGPDDVAGEFTRRTGVGVGDFGMVLMGDRAIPVIVADTGPFNKLGEGSLALHRALGNEQCLSKDANGDCGEVDEAGQSITADVTTVLFPGSAVAGLTPETIQAVTAREAGKRWAALRGGVADTAAEEHD